mgnify:CR=1 FL=1
MLYTITKKMTKKEIKIFENIIGEKIKRIFVRGMPKQLTIVDGMDLFEVILEMENEKIKICCRSSVEIDGDEYVFTDGTDQIKLEIKKRVWNGLNVGPQDKIRVYGKLDNEPFEKPELEVISVEKAQ